MSPRSILHARPRSLRVPTFAALASIATVVACMFATMVVTVHSLETMSKAGRSTTEMTQDTLQLERIVVDLETGVRGRARALVAAERVRPQFQAALTSASIVAAPRA